MSKSSRHLLEYFVQRAQIRSLIHTADVTDVWRIGWPTFQVRNCRHVCEDTTLVSDVRSFRSNVTTAKTSGCGSGAKVKGKAKGR